ncbi:endonuclease/exonuclease/phosphatase family protein [Mucilaginibacter aquatilis]|uniref:Endonuclease n=1 Tax=Mucilaginibacter aquatilis TaxID=1517760 RepID=A0A6I4IC79_9SPHI|nr:endonuclease/exonuclease/phosphatase family protein [Mucilaginibacter aquatilis]MVN92742.1 endonuclease [Mucilaginibacter aquatilis]
MRKRFLLYAVFAFTVVVAKAQQLTVASYNLRFDTKNDTGNLWKDRAPVVANLIRFHDFDVFGTQEALENQLLDITKTLPQYQRYGVGRDDGKEKGEHSAIFFKKDRFKLLAKGDFWLSQTPQKPSLGWDARCCYRLCSWVYLQDVGSGKKFYFFNVHYDHEGKVAREESSKLILQKIKSIAGNSNVILTGDFNGDHTSTWYQRIADSKVLEDTYRKVKFPYVNSGTYNGFGSDIKSLEIIDHIFTSPGVKVNSWGVLTDSYQGKYPSDHFPVEAKIVM